MDVEALQRDLDRMNDWLGKWLMEFNVNKCNVINLDKDNLDHSFTLRNVSLKKSDCERNLGVMVSSDLRLRKQCVGARNSANRVFRFITRSA